MALAAAQSSQLNKAYQTLLSPLDRAHYILSLHGVQESETEQLQDDEFIMQIMEARQEVEEATDAAEINHIKEINKGSIFYLLTQGRHLKCLLRQDRKYNQRPGEQYWRKELGGGEEGDSATKILVRHQTCRRRMGT